MSVSARAWQLVALVAALSTLLVGLAWGTWVAGGSDSYCYVEQAELWAAGAIRTPQPIDFDPPWPQRWMPLAPTGFVPSAAIPGALAPICPSGLSLTMVPFRWVAGRSAVFVVVPLLGAIAVWATFLIGSTLGGPMSGALAAVLLATSPIFLFQLVQPMSDVPAAAWWALAVWLLLRGTPRFLFLAGVATAAAVLTRPVLAPVAAVLVVALLVRPAIARERRVRSAILFCLGALPGAIALAAIQWALYGSPWRSGYGSPAHLFSAAFIVPNVGRYARWALASETPFVLLAVGAWWWLREKRWAALTLLVAIGVVVGCYLPYVPFDDWSYLRFLLPALPLALGLASAVTVAWTSTLPRSWSIAVVVAVMVALGAWHVRTAQSRYAFALRRSEAKFRVVAEYIKQSLPPRAVVLTVWHSGSVRYYGERLTLAWDALPARDLDGSVAFLERHGYTPYFLFEPSEVGKFQSRFAPASPLAALDWPPAAVFWRELRLYRAADRRVYVETGHIATSHVWAP